MTLLVQSSKSCQYHHGLTSQSVVCCLTDVQRRWKQPTIHHETNSRYLHWTTSTEMNCETFCSTLSWLTSHQQHSSHLQCYCVRKQVLLKDNGMNTVLKLCHSLNIVKLKSRQVKVRVMFIYIQAKTLYRDTIT